jgi:xylan 1,4-beta-xylosidase
MLGLLGHERVKVTSSGALPNGEIVDVGVRGQPDINAIATRKGKEVEILVWNYHDEDLPVPAAPIDLVIAGLPTDARRDLLEHFRVDSDHSNAFTVWTEMGSPQSPSENDYQRLKDAGQLQLLSSPAWIEINQGSIHLQFTLPRQGLSLVRLAW